MKFLKSLNLFSNFFKNLKKPRFILFKKNFQNPKSTLGLWNPVFFTAGRHLLIATSSIFTAAACNHLLLEIDSHLLQSFCRHLASSTVTLLYVVWILFLCFFYTLKSLLFVYFIFVLNCCFRVWKFAKVLSLYLLVWISDCSSYIEQGLIEKNGEFCDRGFASFLCLKC